MLEGNLDIDNISGRENNRSVFSSFLELRRRLVYFPSLLFDVTVVVDATCICKSSRKQLMDLIVEYPEIKFVLWHNGEDSDYKNVINNLFPIDKDVSEVCSAVEDIILNNAIDTIEMLYENVDVKNKMSHLEEKIETGKVLPDDLSFLATQWGHYKSKYSEQAAFEDFILFIYTKIVEYLAKNEVCFDLLFFPRGKSNNPIIDLVSGYDNLFDASNLRYACKQWRYAWLHVRRRNFKMQQKSRKNYLAICVEEEREQNRFNSYCLFANGFRVLPIACATELLYLHDNTSLKPSLIIRDYDLQFPDPKEDIPEMKPIDAIRGYTSDGEKLLNSPYWKRYYELKTPIYFISKGNPGSVKIIPPKKYQKRRNKRGELLLPGIVKPVNGIHKPFERIAEVKERYKNTFKKAKPLINTERMNHQHGVPLDIYEVVQSILDRAKIYYQQEKYIYTAILAHEAMEIMNGFHQSLTLVAYHLYAISENAISMNIIGVSEQELKHDTRIRVEKIAKDVGWLLKNRKDNGGKEQSINVLNQIYSDCRNVCREKEHFDSESIFIGAMARLNEGSFIYKYFNT
ncbi:MAG: hypothetical protein J5767_14600 [Paludibacteraceae bacterium]|nr:hypothetical protein [Paludibacteraceae bacterium]